MNIKLIDLDYELILIIIKNLNNKDLNHFKLTCRTFFTIINNKMFNYDKSTRIIVNIIKKYMNNNSIKQRFCKLLQYYIYKPHKQIGINIYYLDQCNKHKFYKHFCLKIRYLAKYHIIDIKIIGNESRILANLSFNPEMIDHIFMCQHLIDMIERYDPTFKTVKILRIKNE